MGESCIITKTEFHISTNMFSINIKEIYADFIVFICAAFERNRT